MYYIVSLGSFEACLQGGWLFSGACLFTEWPRASGDECQYSIATDCGVWF